ncbi:alpha-glucosidase/alpha-galactosidase [Candidatus Bathyarchaeota archaeon ex4484_231]|nr:MAG: alpha-glucosidase/alpha-galactosidase [Candidatus Bathyarchaeota archaeon ex4484_231]RJS76339.1 MAG: alpha-glucosidase/alpha-galactosidase [Candidatus Bathyarchaeota archaeon]
MGWRTFTLSASERFIGPIIELTVNGALGLVKLIRMNDIKISIIGAGSAAFSLALVRDLCLTPNLEGSTVCFMDINEERLKAVYTLCRRYAEETNVKLRLEQTTDRKESLQDADFVINTALVVGYSGYRAGWNLGFKHGYRFGGSLHIMHDEGFWINYYQLRLFESIVNDILDICPDAWYLKLANPVLAGTTFLGRKYPKLKFIGLCHGYLGVFYIASVLGLDREKLAFKAPGVNHFIWMTEFRYNGEDAYPLLDEWIEKDSENYWKTCQFSEYMGPKAVDLYRRFGVFPIGDTCTPGGGSWPWWYHVDDETEKRWKEDPKGWWRWALEPSSVDRASELMKTAYDPSVKVTSVYPPRKSRESIINIVESISCDIPRVFQVNILNTDSFVPGVPRDFEVEVPAVVSRTGVKPERTRGLPKALTSYLLRDRVAPVEIELEAYENGDKERLLDLVMMDPWTRSEEQARNLLNDILALPQYKEMQKHYR